MKHVFLAYAFYWLLLENLGADVNKEARLIRRAYLDTLGVLPTKEELSWYLEYNTDGYRVAVDWLMLKTHGDTKTRLFLLSKEYTEKAPELMDRNVLNRNIFYLSGLEYKEGEEELLMAKKRFIELARKSADSDLDSIDLLCEQLTGRVTKVDEANKLVDLLREKGWLDVLEAILLFDDTKSR